MNSLSVAFFVLSGIFLVAGIAAANRDPLPEIIKGDGKNDHGCRIVFPPGPVSERAWRHVKKHCGEFMEPAFTREQLNRNLGREL